MSDNHDAAHDHDHDHDHGPIFINVFIGLCVLTAVSTAVGTMISRGAMSAPVGWSLMMAVSCAKALLVISFFMHLRWEANWKYVLTIPASFMSIFLVLMLVPDVMQRGLYGSEERQAHQSIEEEPFLHGQDDSHGGQESGHGDHPHKDGDHPQKDGDHEPKSTE